MFIDEVCGDCNDVCWQDTQFVELGFPWPRRQGKQFGGGSQWSQQTRTVFSPPAAGRVGLLGLISVCCPGCLDLLSISCGFSNLTQPGGGSLPSRLYCKKRGNRASSIRSVRFKRDTSESCKGVRLVSGGALVRPSLHKLWSMDTVLWLCPSLFVKL